MSPEEALEKIDNFSSIVAATIPEELEVFGTVYPIARDMEKSGPAVINRYQNLLQEIKSRIMHMDDVPEELVNKGIIIKRVIVFLKDYRKESEVEEQKRWLEYTKRVNP